MSLVQVEEIDDILPYFHNPPSQCTEQGPCTHPQMCRFLLLCTWICNLGQERRILFDLPPPCKQAFQCQTSNSHHWCHTQTEQQQAPQPAGKSLDHQQCEPYILHQGCNPIWICRIWRVDISPENCRLGQSRKAKDIVLGERIF